MLYVPQVGIINPSEMEPDKSLEAVVWVALGGRGTLLGPVLGAFGVNVLKSWATRAYPDSWLLLLGGVLRARSRCSCPKDWSGLPEQLATAARRRAISDRTAEPAPAGFAHLPIEKQLAKTE